MNISKYLRTFIIFIKASFTKELDFRFNFIMTLIGSFCFIVSYILTLVFLFNNISIGNWSTKDMWLLLGIALTIYYAIFYLFWRGLVYLGRNIINGQFDFYLLRPIDTQFLSSFRGGGMHNLIALIFGIALTIVAISNLGINVTPFTYIFFILAIIISILDFSNLLFAIMTLSFKYGDAAELFYLAFNFQDIMRYPAESFFKAPIMLLLIAVPFSALSTVPAMILKSSLFPFKEFAVFVSLSIVFNFLVRIFWISQLKFYTSGS